LLESVGINAERFGSAEEFMAQWQQDKPGCLLLDARLPGMTGVEFQEKLVNSARSIPIIFMTAHGDVPMVRKVMKAGAIEFLTKPFQKEELLEAIRSALEIDRSQRQDNASNRSIRVRFASLRSREREVLHLVAAGFLNKQIAASLNLSEITVKLHRRHVMEKMQANSLADLVRMADTVKKMDRHSSPNPS
jgi:FixJ family two-component response regulator